MNERCEICGRFGHTTSDHLAGEDEKKDVL